jgi:L-fucose dehydrogenase
MNLNLKDKIIIVTGGGGLPGSIGETIIRHLACENAIPVIIDKHPRGQKMVETMKNDGSNAFFIYADLTTNEGCQKAVEKTLKKFGRIDALVNNMGINDQVSLNDSYDDFIASLKLNLAHYFGMTKYAAPYLKKAKGSIVNIASKVAVTGQGGTSGYAASKGGVLALTREWAVDLSPDNVRVNAVVIAESWTPAYERWIKKFDNPEKMRQEIAQKVPLGKRMTQPGEIADTVLFLLSDRSSHTTGQIIHVDGGYVHLDRAIS